MPTIFQLPFPESTITSHFGPRPAPFPGASTNHLGTDFGAGGTIVPVAHGKVTAKAETESATAGWWVEYQADDGTFWLCMHMAHRSPMEVDKRVARGATKLGTVGQTGTADADHLHLGASTAHFGGFNGTGAFDLVPYIRARTETALAAFALLAVPEELEIPTVMRFRTKQAFYFASFDDVEAISELEAKAINAALGADPFTEVSSARAKLIIEGCRRRRVLRDGLDNDSVRNMDELITNEPGTP